jgi:DNA-binding GntR family transcriptional regulator
VTQAIAAAEPDATSRAVRVLRDMVMNRRLAPGQQLRQDSLADELGLSRSPLREALRMLETEGLLEHLPNQGYFVTRLRSGDMQQIYLMRRLLETELYRSIRRPQREDVARVRAVHRQIGERIERRDLSGVLEGNRRFHFEIFGLSPLDVITRHVERLWRQSESYRAVYLFLPETQRRIDREHTLMLRHIETVDIPGLIRVADAHRAAAETSVVAFLRSEEG